MRLGALQQPPLPSLFDIRGSLRSAARLEKKAVAREPTEAHRLVLQRARENAEDFIEYAFRLEENNEISLKNAPFHVEWQQILREHKYAVIIAAVEHAKTQQIGIAKPIHLLGNNPNLRGAIISNTAQQAEKMLGSIRGHIERNQAVREVFPHLRRSSNREHPWHQTMLTVERDTIAKDPSIQALGIEGPIVGSRLDFVILDDVLNFDNTRTPERCKTIIDRFETEIWTRLTANGVCWAIGTPWNNMDLLAELQKRPGWYSKVFSAVENPDDQPNEWRPIWFSKERLIERADNMTVHNFARKYLCKVKTAESARFRQEWLDLCLAAGRGRYLLDRAPVTPGGRRYPCYTGVDLGVGQDENNDLTVLFTIAVDDSDRRIVVDVQSGRWQSPEIIQRIFDVQRRYGSIVTVESNGAQQYILQWAGAEGLAVRPFRTDSRNKHSEAFGIESLAVEFRAGKWIIPSGITGQELDPEVRAWIQQIIFYTPGAHTGDHLMASWFARETARDSALPRSQSMDTLTR